MCLKFKVALFFYYVQFFTFASFHKYPCYLRYMGIYVGVKDAVFQEKEMQIVQFVVPSCKDDKMP